jgi:hypothetical protein
VPILLPGAIFLSPIFLSDHAGPMTRRYLNRDARSMSATSPNLGELRAFSMNDTVNPAAASNLSIRFPPDRPLGFNRWFAGVL